MENPTPSQELYDQFVSLNQKAFSAGLYNSAYHSLMAALHCARNLNDDQGLLGVEEIAREQLEWIDQHKPDYEHSTRSAAKRNHESIFALLAREASMAVLTRKTARQNKQIKQK